MLKQIIFQFIKIYINYIFLIRIATCSLMVLWVYLTPTFKDSNSQYPFYFYLICILINVLNSTPSTTQSVTQMSFFTRVSGMIN